MLMALGRPAGTNTAAYSYWSRLQGGLFRQSCRWNSSEPMQSLHRVRERWVMRRTSIVNQIRGLLLERGITLRKGRRHVDAALLGILEDADSKLSGALRVLLAQLKLELDQMAIRINEADAVLNKTAHEDEACQQLVGIPGIACIASLNITPASQIPRRATRTFQNSRKAHMIATPTTAPALQDCPVRHRDLRALIAGWDVTRPADDLIAALNEQCSQQPKKGKSMSRRKGQQVKIEVHRASYTFRGRVDVEGQDKRRYKRIQIAPIKRGAPGWLNASQRRRKAVKMMAELEGNNEDVVLKPGKLRLPTFAEQAKIHLRNLEDSDDPAAISTLAGYRSYLSNWLLPMFGDLPIDSITNTSLRELVAWMKKGGPVPRRKG